MTVETNLNTLPAPAAAFDFPAKLYKMLADAETDGHEDIFSWLPDGVSFRIHKRSEFISKILPKHYYRINIRSFLRQLNLYGFKREKDKKSKAYGAYHHQHFIRSDNLGLIRRRMVSRKRGTQEEWTSNKKNILAQESWKHVTGDDESCGVSHCSSSTGIEAMPPGLTIKSKIHFDRDPAAVPSAVLATTPIGPQLAALEPATIEEASVQSATALFLPSPGAIHRSTIEEPCPWQLSESIAVDAPEQALSLSSPLNVSEPTDDQTRQVLALFLDEEDATTLLRHGTRDFVLDSKGNMGKIRRILQALEPLPLASSC